MTFALTALNSPLVRSGSEMRARYLLRQIVGTTLASLPEEQITYVSGSLTAHFLPDVITSTTATSMLESSGPMFRRAGGSALTRFSNAPSAESATAFTNNSAVRHGIQTALKSLCAISQDDFFEVGINNNLTVGLRALFSKYPHTVLDVIPEILQELPASAEAIHCEILTTLANIDHPTTLSQRLLLAAEYLTSSSARVRDSAALALSYLDDVAGIPYLYAAIDRERLGSLRADMQYIVDQIGR